MFVMTVGVFHLKIRGLVYLELRVYLGRYNSCNFAPS